LRWHRRDAPGDGASLPHINYNLVSPISTRLEDASKSRFAFKESTRQTSDVSAVPKPQTLTMHLVKADFAGPREILKDPNSLKHYAIGNAPGAIGDLYVPAVFPK